MKHREPARAVYLAAILATEAMTRPPHVAARDAESLVRMGAKANRIAVDQCNRPWDDSDYARAEKTLAGIDARAIEILDCYGAEFDSCQRDPRGFGLTFNLKSGRSNSMGGGWGV